MSCMLILSITVLFSVYIVLIQNYKSTLINLNESGARRARTYFLKVGACRR